jgi:ABC-type sugar transport system substrate-binding protein
MFDDAAMVLEEIAPEDKTRKEVLGARVWRINLACSVRRRVLPHLALVKSPQKDRQCLANKNRQSRSSALSSINLHLMKSIAVIPKSTADVFWKAVEAEAREGAKEARFEMVWKGSLKEDDPAQQIQIVEQFVSEGVGGIVLAPIDDTALKRPVAAAMQKRIPVVIAALRFSVSAARARASSAAPLVGRSTSPTLWRVA